MTVTQTNMRKKALVLTVGTGDIDDLERTLLMPMKKSTDAGEWERVVLLPSHTTQAYAQTLQERIPHAAVEIKPLPEPEQENDADSCFGHFDAVLEDLISSGFKSGDIHVDFTRGTKAMSAALVLAAVGRDIQVLRYVYGGGRDERGMVVPGTERVGQVLTIRATARRRLERARGFMRQGGYGAVTELLPDPSGPLAELPPDPFLSEAMALHATAQIYTAWDRLDYKAAVEVMEQLGPRTAEAGDFAPTPEMCQYLKKLARHPERTDHKAMAEYLRALACDLLANAERRLRDRHFEDALIRAYRVLELIGQIRMFAHGYDSTALCPDDEQIKALQNKLRRGEHDFDEDKRTGKLIAPRRLAARLLKRLEDPLAERLLKFDSQHDKLRTSSRNHSVLIHGFEAKAPPDKGPLQEVLGDLAELLNEDDARAGERLKVARSLSFAKE